MPQDSQKPGSATAARTAASSTGWSLVTVVPESEFLGPVRMTIRSLLIGLAALIAAAIYLILEMSTPFSGPIQLSDRPLVRAAEEIRR